MLPGRDQTEIGERGINLSGGQKQRISIARIAYSNSDIILIDDALSAVDAEVGKNLNELVFNGLFKNKTKIMATHALQYIKNADQVIFVENGEIIM